MQLFSVLGVQPEKQGQGFEIVDCPLIPDINILYFAMVRPAECFKLISI